MKRSFLFLTLLCTITLMICACTAQAPVANSFDAERAYEDVQTQVLYGDRIPGSTGHQQTLEYIQSELQNAGWKVEIQNTTYQGHPVQNITAKRADSTSPVILAAHYDTRMYADQDSDPNLYGQPVPGANDGASGVAVLLEMARVMPADQKNVWLVFFDTEDQGHIKGWDWILGSQAYADALTVSPQAVIVIDMIGDTDLNIYREKSSDQTLTDQIWQAAADLGYSDQFINEEKYNMLDDHTPFLEKGIPAVDIIDFDYPYWHTTQDTDDKVSAESLSIVGNTLLSWLKSSEPVGK
ncbi:MAG: M28 family peptidase [Anaerolineaceae bacterium]|nr:M28 family peptidase [Anaerolineaceae bacterium]